MGSPARPPQKNRPMQGIPAVFQDVMLHPHAHQANQPGTSLPVIVFIAGWWLLDALMVMATSDADLAAALLPEGWPAVKRALVAVLVGWLGSNLLRNLHGPARDAADPAAWPDVPEFQDASCALQDREEYFRAVVDNSLDLVTIIDQQGTILFCSPSSMRVLGFDRRELLGKCIFDLVYPEDEEAARLVVATGFDNPGSRNSLTLRFMNRDREILQIESIGQSFINSSGVRQAVINSRDITERQRTSDQLQHAQKLQSLGQLTGGIAHDFNNLLTVIVGNLQLIEHACAGTEQASQAQGALQAAFRGAELTRRMLSYARRQPLDPCSVDVRGLLGNMDTFLRRSLGSLMQIRITCDEDAWLAHVDPTQLESVILNLAINARDASDSQGKIDIRVENCQVTRGMLPDDCSARPGDFLHITIADDGAGMEADTLRRAIEPFFTTKPEGLGSGLGLSMVYGFMQQSGGFLRVDSLADVGTTVHLFIPRAYGPPCTADGRYDEAIPRGCETVLVVDDTDDVVRAAASMLESLGYEVITAGSGGEALRILEGTSVHLLFTDVRMPGMSGVDLARQVQRLYPATQTVVTSGFSDEWNPQSPGAASQFPFLPKPYTQQALAACVRKTLDRQP